MSAPEYLYHYTSLETLALILENRTLCFNSLLNVDDVEEAEVSDIKHFGKYVFVSCWTDEKKEMIPMWNLYTPNMHGVRIRLPQNPFKKYTYRAGEFGFTDDTDSYIDYREVYRDNRGMIAPSMPLLKQVNYTNEAERLFPKVRTKGTADDVRRFLSGEYENVELAYSLVELGQNKREVWRFQKEWRYIFEILPFGMQDEKTGSLEHHQEFVRKLEDEQTEPPYQRFFLELSEDAINQMEVVFGPRMNEAEKILAKALLRTHGLEGHWKNSDLKIR